jgi:selenocysteine lyase/cysteine desulfurase
VDLCQVADCIDINLSAEPNIIWAVLSGEKIFGTCGVGILYCREGFDHYTPVQWGGGAAQPLNLENRLHVESGPAKMESGTQNIAGIIGMGAAADLIMYSGGPRAINDAVETRRIKLYKENIDQLSSDFELVYGPRQLAKTLCFRSKKYNPSDIAQLLAEQNIAVRAGKICANTYVNKISDNGVLRISIAPYNTDHDCEQLVDGLRHSLKTLKGKN